MEQLTPALAEYGLLGIIIAALGWAYWQKDKQLQAANAERIKDSERLFETVATLREALALVRDRQ